MFKYFFLLAFSIAFGKYIHNGTPLDIVLMLLCGLLSFISDVYLVKTRQDAALRKLTELLEVQKQEIITYQDEQNQLKGDIQKLNSAFSATMVSSCFSS